MSETKTPAVVAATTHTVRSLVDGTLSVTIHVEPRHVAQWVQAFGVMPGTPVAVARLDPVAAQAHATNETTNAEREDYGTLYRCLHLMGWFHNPKVRAAFRVPETLDAEERIRAIKRHIYTETGADSLKEIPPQYFMAVCNALGIQDTVPREIRDAAEGQAI